MGAFQNSKGVTILTNKPEKYRGRSGYTEVILQLEPIQIPPQYRNRQVPSDYSTGEIGELVHRYAGQYGVDERLIYAIIQVESNGNPSASSPKGALGLMQLMPQTAADMGVQNIYDPAQNIAGGTQYIARLLELFNNDQSLALAGYNAGPENVKKWNGIPPFEETQNYVRRVLELTGDFNKNGVNKTYLAQNFGTPTFPASAPSKPEPEHGARKPVLIRKADTPIKYRVRFKSGTIQEAENVIQDGDYYYIAYKGYSFRVRTTLVDNITPPPGGQKAGTTIAAKM